MGALMLVAMSSSANAARMVVSGASGASVTGALPGQVLWTDYETFIDGGGLVTGDTIIRLINPNGAANTGITGESEQPVCAMIYVFDDDEEMAACCGCPLSSAGLLTFSVAHNLTANGIFTNDGDLGNGVIAMVAAAPIAPSDRAARATLDAIPPRIPATSSRPPTTSWAAVP
jgi:hypothetical protein